MTQKAILDIPSGTEEEKDETRGAEGGDKTNTEEGNEFRGEEKNRDGTEKTPKGSEKTKNKDGKNEQQGNEKGNEGGDKTTRVEGDDGKPDLDDTLGLTEKEEPATDPITDEDLKDEKDITKLTDEDREETSIMDELEKAAQGNDDDKLDLPANFEEMAPHEQDEEIALALEDDKTWKDWRETAQEVHGEVDRKFAVDALRAGFTPEYLSQRGIYSLQDFQKRLTAEEGKTSEDALILADPTNEEERAEFFEEHFGIPKEKEGYDVTGLVGTRFHGDESATAELLEQAHRLRWSQNQMLAYAHELDKTERDIIRENRRETNKYKADQKKLLESIYGEAGLDVASAALKALRTTSGGQAFLKEFKDDKVVASANLFGAIAELLKFKTTTKDINLLTKTREEDGVVVDQKALKAFSTEDLIAKRDKLMEHSSVGDDKAAHPDPNVRARYLKVRRAIARLHKEIERREDIGYLN